MTKHTVLKIINPFFKYDSARLILRVAGSTKKARALSGGNTLVNQGIAYAAAS